MTSIAPEPNMRASTSPLAAQIAEEGKHVSRSFTFRYILALSLIALIVTAGWINLRVIVASQESTATVVNISGRQRMLSQRITLFAGELVRGDEEVRSPLRSAVSTMRNSHEALMKGNSALGIPSSSSSEIENIYDSEGLDAEISVFLTAADQLLNTPAEELGPENENYLFISQSGPDRLLRLLDRAVQQYEKEGREAVQLIERLEFTVWLAAILLLTAEALLIFRPMATRIRSVFEDLASSVGINVAGDKRLQSICEKLPTPFMILDDEGRILSVSDQWLAQLGYRRSEVMGRSIGDFLGSKSGGAAEALIERALSAPDGRLEEEIFLSMKTDGSQKYVLSCIQSSEGPGSGVQFYCVMNHSA